MPICTLTGSSVWSGGAAPTLSSEIFIQSDRLAAFVVMGIQRWGMLAVLGFAFPFLIVSTTIKQSSIPNTVKAAARLEKFFVNYHWTIVSYGIKRQKPHWWNSNAWDQTCAQSCLPTVSSLPECPELILLCAVRLRVPAGLSLYFLPPAWDQGEDPDGDLRGV